MVKSNGESTRGIKLNCRILSTTTNDAYTNMAIDEAILKTIGREKAPPTLRFFRWKPSAISLGFFQSLEHEVNIEAASDHGMDIVRRLTGGGTVFHDYDGELTYSFIAPKNMIPDDIVSSFRKICKALEGGLNEMGVEAQYREVNDVEVDGRKISGSAQTRRYGAFLQHGTILIDINLEKMFKVLKIPEEKTSDKFITSAKKRVTSLKKQLDKKPTIDQVEKSLSKGFEKQLDLNLTEKSVSDEEQKMAKEIRKKYNSDKWIERR